MEASLQWAAFQRLAEVLISRDNQICVVIGPFNEHMVSAGNLERYRTNKSVAEAWLQERGVVLLSPDVLPSDSYGDASHPLTDGYALMAERLLAAPEFQSWLDD